MLTLPNTAAILVGVEKDRTKYSSRAAKLRGARGTFQEDQTNQEIAALNGIKDAAAVDPDLFCDHVLYKFPKKITTIEVGALPGGVVPHTDIIYYTEKKLIEQKDKTQLDMTSTLYVLTVHVGIKGTKRPLEAVDTTTAIDFLTAEVSGMTLSPTS